MLQLIHTHNNENTTFISQSQRTSHAVAKCLRFIKQVLQLDCELAKFDSSSTKYLVLEDLAQTKNYIELNSQTFLSIYKSNGEVWGFLEIKSQILPPSLSQIRKAGQAIKDIIEPELVDTFKKRSNKKSPYSLLLLEASPEQGHRVATGLFYSQKFTSFINLEEWIKNGEDFSLPSLREFQDALFFVPEVFDLSRSQRSVLALYELLPEKLKSSSLVICTKSSNFDLEKLLGEEKGFAQTFQNHKAVFYHNIEKQLSL